MAYLESRYYLAGHRAVKGVEFLRAVELDCSNAVYAVKENITELVAGLFFGKGG